MTDHTQQTFLIPVAGGMCELKFQFGCSTGPGDDTNPGVGFDFISDSDVYFRNGKYYGGCGVIGRAHAKLLADAIYTLLEAHPLPSSLPSDEKQT